MQQNLKQNFSLANLDHLFKKDVAKNQLMKSIIWEDRVNQMTNISFTK